MQVFGDFYPKAWNLHAEPSTINQNMTKDGLAHFDLCNHYYGPNAVTGCGSFASAKLILCVGYERASAAE
jgi:hypothetical protein